MYRQSIVTFGVMNTWHASCCCETYHMTGMECSKEAWCRDDRKRLSFSDMDPSRANGTGHYWKIQSFKDESIPGRQTEVISVVWAEVAVWVRMWRDNRAACKQQKHRLMQKDHWASLKHWHLAWFSFLPIRTEQLEGLGVVAHGKWRQVDLWFWGHPSLCIVSSWPSRAT